MYLIKLIRYFYFIKHILLLTIINKENMYRFTTCFLYEIHNHITGNYDSVFTLMNKKQSDF